MTELTTGRVYARWWRGALLVFAHGVASMSGCIGPRESCEMNSDCTSAVCSSRGYCQKECGGANDCPCGSTCLSACGLCIRDDRLGPATCFAFDHGLSTDEALGACGITVDGGSVTAFIDTQGDADAEGRICSRPPLTQPTCPKSLPRDSIARRKRSTKRTNR